VGSRLRSWATMFQHLSHIRIGFPIPMLTCNVCVYIFSLLMRGFFLSLSLLMSEHVKRLEEGRPSEVDERRGCLRRDENACGKVIRITENRLDTLQNGVLLRSCGTEIGGGGEESGEEMNIRIAMYNVVKEEKKGNC